MRIKEYKTAWADSVQGLDAEVNRLLGKGFELYGNAYQAARAGEELGAVFCQAMVRHGAVEAVQQATQSEALEPAATVFEIGPN